ncbi:MAG: SDR family NAD(P)-dependent oxidoreductase [Sphaerochaetaceae bacterium]|nr:SDR family NAD(P)-dependent oxidoreductase [Sphaerochaetaceae bacterium]
MKRNVLVTGGTGGIGFAIAKEFGKLGDNVIISDIDETKGQAKLKELKDLGYSADFYKVDSTNEDEVNKAMALIEEKYKTLDILINCAGGLGGRSRFESMETSFYRFVMALNLDSAFFTTRAAIPMLKRSKNASIINFASNAAWNAGGPGAGIYGTSKAAVVTLTRALAKDLAEYGIRVNAVSPGTIDTPFHENIKRTNPQVFESWKNNILLKRFGKPEEVASVIKFLTSDDASFLTGEIIQINGGQDFI